MDERSEPLPAARSLLKLASRNRNEARLAMARLSLEEQLAAVCDAPLEQRAAVLDLVPAPEAVIPLLPEAELCFICKHLGVHDASSLLASASNEQIAACLDLDAWHGLALDRAKLDSWLASLAEAGNETLLRSAQTLDPEMLALHLRSHVDVVLKPSGDEDWQPPDTSQTLEGQFYFVARQPGDDLATTLQLLHVLFREDYWLYFRMMQSVREELEPEIEEWALRWRTGRLEDLGFPPWDSAMRIYGHLRPENLAEIPSPARARAVADWKLPVWITHLPEAAESGHSLFRTATALGPGERGEFFYSFISLANRVAVADRKGLGDADTLPDTIEKAAAVASRGLEHIAAAHELSLIETLRRVPLERLFRVGVNLDPDGVRPTLSEAGPAGVEDDSRGDD